MDKHSERKPVWADSALYEQGVAHFEAEEWDQAIELFSQLAAEFPEDQELQQMLADLRLKASLPREETTKRLVSRLRRPVLVALGVVAVIAVLAGVSYAIYTNWLVPARTLRAEVAHVRELHELARGYMAAGEYERAADLYEEILSQAPDDTTSSAGLARAEELQELASAYDRALELTQEERWDEAVEAWRAIMAVDPNFRDVKYWAGLAEEEYTVGSLLRDAELRHASEDWSGAIEILEQVRARDASYRRDEVEKLLVSSLANLAEQTLSDASDPAGVYDQVMDLFDRALQIRPQDETVIRQQEIAEAYSLGHALLQEEDWEGALEELAFVYEHEPSYAAGRVVDLLYLANLRCGDQRAEEGDLQGALACYESASNLPVNDSSEASSSYAALVPMLTATPTPRPPVATPTATRRPSPTPTESPYTYQYVAGSAQDWNRSGCPAPSIEGRVLDASGVGEPGVWVRLEWWGNHRDFLTGYNGEFGFAPLAQEHFADAVPFRLTVIRHPSDPAPQSPTVPLDFRGCWDHDGFSNITFRAWR